MSFRIFLTEEGNIKGLGVMEKTGINNSDVILTTKEDEFDMKL